MVQLELDALNHDRLSVTTVLEQQNAPIETIQRQLLLRKQGRPARERVNDNAQRALLNELQSIRDTSGVLKSSSGMLTMQVKELEGIQEDLEKELSIRLEAHQIDTQIMGILNQAANSLGQSSSFN